MNENKSIVARMLVPKMVKNGVNSASLVRVTS
jgi:hypothetical protein